MITRAVLAAAGSILTPDVTQKVVLVHAADEVPFYSALQAQGLVEDTGNVKFEWASDALEARRTLIDNGGSAYTSGTTTLVVDSSAAFFANAVIRAEATGEIMLCTSVTDGVTIVVVRGIGSSEGGVAAHADSVANNAALIRVGVAMSEASTTPTERGGAPTMTYNYTQIYRRTVAVTGTTNRSQTNTENERNRQRAVQLAEITRDIEMSLLAGTRSLSTVSSASKFFTGGMTRYITSNVDNVAGSMTLARLNTALGVCWNGGGSGEKWGFAGATAAAAIDNIFGAKLQTASGETMPGLVVRKVPHRSGILNLVTHRLMVGALATDIIVVDPAVVALRHLGGQAGRLQLKNDIQAPGTDATVDEWFADVGLHVGPEQLHGWIKGITGAA